MLNVILWVLAVLGGGAVVYVVTNLILDATERRRKQATDRAVAAAIERYATYYGSTDRHDPWAPSGRARNASVADLRRLADRVAALEPKKTKKEKAHV